MQDRGVQSFRSKFRAEKEQADTTAAIQPPPPLPRALKPAKSALTCNLTPAPEEAGGVVDTKRPRYSAIAEQLGFLNDDGTERLLAGQAARNVDRKHLPLGRQGSRRARP